MGVTTMKTVIIARVSTVGQKETGMKRLFLLIISLTAFLLFTSTNTPLVGASYGLRSKTSNCASNQALPDSNCTPGAILTTDKSTICVVGYTKTVRSVSSSVRKEVFKEYGVSLNKSGLYEVDHLVSLELGGSNDISNLWPESYDIQNGARIKDKLENYLHSQVCKGALSLQEAQAEIANNWLATYNKVYNPQTITKPFIGPKVTPKTTTKPQVLKPTVPKATPVPVPAPTQTDNANNSSIPSGATALCNDGTYSYAANHQGACSHHGGVKEFYK